MSDDGLDIPQDEVWIPGWIMDELLAAIVDAKIVFDDPLSTDDELQAAIADLNDALDLADMSKANGNAEIDMRPLDALIAQAQAALQAVVISALNGYDTLRTEQWVSPAAYAAMEGTLQDAIAIRVTLTGILADQGALTSAVQMLTAALASWNPQPGLSIADKALLWEKIREAQEAMAGVMKSANGSDIADEQMWVNTAIFEALESALTAAQQQMFDADANQAAVDGALSTLTAALGAFNPQPGTLPSSFLEYTFTGPQDETINMGADRSLSWVANTTATITIAGGFDTHVWYVNGILIPDVDGNSYVLRARDYHVADNHQLTVRVTRDGVPYSKILIFSVY